MASRPLQSVPGLQHAHVYALSQRLGAVTCGDILVEPEVQVMAAIERGFAEARGIVETVARVVRPTCMTARSLAAASAHGRPHSTGLPTFDKRTHGGLQCSSVTELVGPAGAGKTQTCMTLTVLASSRTALGGHGEAKSVVYIDTENKFSAARLLDIACARFPEFYGPPHSRDASHRERCVALAGRVKLFRVSSAKALVNIVKDLGRVVIEERVGLVVLDSMASILRREFGAENFVARQDVLGGTAAHLKSVADRFRIPVVVTNQVTTSMGLQPALGNTWAHCVNTRVLLQSEGSKRVLTVAKSPLSSRFSVHFRIDTAGIVEDDSAEAPSSHTEQRAGDVSPHGASVGMENFMAAAAVYNDVDAAKLALG